MPGATFTDCKDFCPQMVVLPAGSYVMGSPESELERKPNEAQHRVAIAYSFAVGKYDVTRGEYARFIAQTGYKTTGTGCYGKNDGKWSKQAWRTWDNPGFEQTDSHPAVCQTWDDAKAYVAWLAGKTGRPYRLLSEAEWEYAARAGTATARHWGPGLTHDNANYGANPCCDMYIEGRDQWAYTSPSGAFAPNDFGLYDMLGNVWQWLEDCANPSYENAPVDGSAWLSGDCKQRMRRGGGWVDRGNTVRSASRFWIEVDHPSADSSFRVALTL